MTTPKSPPEETHPDAPPSEAELREALADPTRSSEDAELARALALAHAPRPLDEDEHGAILKKALAQRSASPPHNVIVVMFGFAGVIAAAAVLVLLVGSRSDRIAPKDPSPLAQSRSTQPLFREPFAREGGESARIDRIALARSGDLRDNEFRRWGVR
jgi:hypothetical protein